MTTATEARIEASTGREQRVKMTYDEFIAHVPDVHAEWVDGEVISFMPPLPLHQRIADFLSRLLALYAEILNLGIVISAPLEMRVTPTSNAREPDVLFVLREHAQRIDKWRLNGPADLAVEIISTESLYRDRSDKFYEYQEGGVGEYWIIDPRPGKERVELYVLNEQGRYQAVLPDATGRYASSVVAGFWFREEWLREGAIPEVQPTLASVLPLDRRAVLAQKLGL